MLAEERWDAILNLVEQEKTVTVPRLMDLLDASESTVRRDLTQLDRMKKLNKVHGGATKLDQQYVANDQYVNEKYDQYKNEKMLIGKYAARLIRPDDFVYIDAGTTAEALVDQITETRAVYMTDSIIAASKLLHKGCRVILPEGELKDKTEAIVGELAVASIRRYHFTLGFWGTNGLSPETGYTTPEIHEAMVKETSMKQTERRYMLCDHSKFKVISPVTFGAFNSATIITDHVDDVRLKAFKNIVEVKE